MINMPDIIKNLYEKCYADGVFEYRDFAQMIISECLEICERGTDTQTTSAGAAQLIKLHFGIK